MEMKNSGRRYAIGASVDTRGVVRSADLTPSSALPCMLNSRRNMHLVSVLFRGPRAALRQQDPSGALLNSVGAPTTMFGLATAERMLGLDCAIHRQFNGHRSANCKSLNVVDTY
jgi:hypothetical protein